MRLGVDPVALGILLAAFVFSRIPGVNARLGNGAMAAACGVVGYRYWVRVPQLQFNQVMAGLAGLLALYYLFKAIKSAAPKRRADDEE